MSFWTNIFNQKAKLEMSKKFMDSIREGDRDAVQSSILLLGDRKDKIEVLKKGLDLSKKTRWHAVTSDLQKAIKQLSFQTEKSFHNDSRDEPFDIIKNVEEVKLHPYEKVKKCFAHLDSSVNLFFSADSDHDMGPSFKALPHSIGDDLSKIGKGAIPYLLKPLESSSFRYREAAYYALVKLNALTPDLKIRYSIAELEDINNIARLNPIFFDGLADIFRGISFLTPEIAQVLALGLSLNARGGEVLGDLSTVFPETFSEVVVPTLINLIEDANYMAAHALGKIGLVTPEVVPTLIRALDSSSEEVCRMAARVLGEMSSATPEAVPALIGALESPNGGIWGGPADVLGEIGPVTPEVIPALIKALESPNQEVRREAANALGEIGPVTPEVIPALIRVLESPNQEVRRGAANALGEIGPVIPDIVTALIRALESGREEAASALAGIGPVNPEVVPVLIRALESSDGNVWSEAVHALVRIGPVTPDIVPSLIKVLRNRECCRAADVLGKIGPATPEVVPALIRALESSNEKVCSRAIHALEEIGGKAEMAVPALKKLLKRSNNSTRIKILSALEKIWAS